MLAVNGIMYNLCAYIVRSLLTAWCKLKKQDIGHTVWFLPGPEHSTAHVHP